MDTIKKTARIAGLLYLIVGLTGVFSLMYVPSKLIVSGDATETANNIIASTFLYRAGIVGGLICQTSFLLLVLALYKLLKHVNNIHATVMVAFVVVAVPIAFLNSINQFAALILLSGDNYLSVFNQEQLYAQVMVFLKLYGRGLLVAEIFWALWLFPLGYLVYKSGLFPRIFGILLIAGCFGYLINFFVSVFFPAHMEITYPGSVISSIAEFSFLFYLLIKGVKQPSSDYRVSVS